MNAEEIKDNISKIIECAIIGGNTVCEIELTKQQYGCLVYSSNTHNSRPLFNSDNTIWNTASGWANVKLVPDMSVLPRLEKGVWTMVNISHFSFFKLYAVLKWLKVNE